MRFLLPAALALFFTVQPARAVTFFSVGAAEGPFGKIDPGPAAFETTLVTYDQAPHSGVTVTHSGSGSGLYTGDHSGVAASPAGDATQYMALATGESELIDFRGYFAAMNQRVRSLSVYVGSVDSYNYIDVLGVSGGALDLISPLLTIAGNDLPSQSGDWGSSMTNRRLFINFDPLTENVGGLRFRSTGVAFEFDTVAASGATFLTPPGNAFDTMPPITAVPEPAAWTMLIGGFGLVGGAMRMRRRREARAIA